MAFDWESGGFSIYIHWPFCQSKCPYCDFNSHVSQSIDHNLWCEALLKDLTAQAEPIKGRKLTSVFFGGGTPSLMQPQTVDALLNAINTLFEWGSEVEVTLEANPTSVEAQKFIDFKSAGVTRVSIGVQSLRDDDLKALGRLHSSDEAKQAIALAQRTFDKMSFDLIYARQHQTAREWEKELQEAITLSADHLSLYQLTIEKGTPFAARHSAGGLQGLPNDATSAELYQLTYDICQSEGFERYEVSNYARKNALCKHNLTYWKYGDYLGVGPGAHGRVTLPMGRIATLTPLMPDEYLKSVFNAPIDWCVETLTNEASFIEAALMGLRLSSGIDLNRFAPLGSHFNEEAIDFYLSKGDLWRHKSQLGVAQESVILLNQIMKDILS